MSKLAVVLLSGGMDSVVTACVARKEYGYDLAFLHFKYGQRVERAELERFWKLVEWFKPRKHLVIDLSMFKLIGGSSLVDLSLDVFSQSESGDGIPLTYVPFRNGIFLSIAASWAEVIGAEVIFIGASQVDFAGYPDCRREFLKAMELAVNEGTKPEFKVQIVAPLLDMSKGEIVRKGIELGAPFHLTWSCYVDSEVACGVCESCRLRLKGFEDVGVEDPIPYRVSEK